jgi:hypothetical protein
MPIVVVGGHSRNIGKTSVVSGLISAFQEHKWTAIKISQHAHDLPLRAGESNNGEPSFAISEEFDRGGGSDTSRFLAAGAARGWWVRTHPGRLEKAMPAIYQCIADSAFVILESNSILKFLTPDLYIAVLDPAVEDFKPSAQEFLDRADAFVVHEGSDETLIARNLSRESIATPPIFPVKRPSYISPALVEFVRDKFKALSRG